MVIAVDAAGGDYYPGNPVLGAIEAIREKEEISILLVGPEQVVREELERHEYDRNRIDILHAPEVIGMEESPSAAVKSKRHSSIVVGLEAHRQNRCNAFVSAGNTGALLAASVLILGKLKGVQRPTIGAVFPSIHGPRLLLDAGASLELKCESYLQFAQMGTIYSREIMNVREPSVGLLNIGEEPEKGTDLLRGAHRLLSTLPNFCGNVEGGDIFTSPVDVIVCDGLIGNILLKFGESIPSTLYYLMEQTMKEMALDAGTRETVLQVVRSTLRSFNYEHVGGIPFLGVNGVSMVGHGESSPTAIKNMILNAAQCVESSVNEKIVSSLHAN